MFCFSGWSWLSFFLVRQRNEPAKDVLRVRSRRAKKSENQEKNVKSLLVVLVFFSWLAQRAHPKKGFFWVGVKSTS